MLLEQMGIRKRIAALTHTFQFTRKALLDFPWEAGKGWFGGGEVSRQSDITAGENVEHGIRGKNQREQEIVGGGGG